jgi:hypothetical protein
LYTITAELLLAAPATRPFCVSTLSVRVVVGDWAVRVEQLNRKQMAAANFCIVTPEPLLLEVIEVGPG